MDEVRIENGISIENINKLVEWTNTREAKYLELWSGKELSFPLTAKQLESVKNSLYSIYKGENFLGIIQKIKEEDKNVHIGKFVINPEYTGRGMGKVALKLMCNHIFANPYIETITLNVLDYNQSAISLYKKVGFQVEDSIKDGSSTLRYKMKLDRLDIK